VTGFSFEMPDAPSHPDSAATHEQWIPFAVSKKFENSYIYES
jgi:hypothetical protein